MRNEFREERTCRSMHSCHETFNNAKLLMDHLHHDSRRWMEKTSSYQSLVTTLTWTVNPLTQTILPRRQKTATRNASKGQLKLKTKEIMHGIHHKKWKWKTMVGSVCHYEWSQGMDKHREIVRWKFMLNTWEKYFCIRDLLKNVPWKQIIYHKWIRKVGA